MRYTDGTNTVTAKNYKDAAKKLYGQKYYHNPGTRNDLDNDLPTTYTHVHKGYADVTVYNVGDKQGNYWGVKAARPKRYTLHSIK